MVLGVAVVVGTIVFLDWRHLSCEEWREQEHEFEMSGGYAPISDPRPEWVTPRDFERTVDKLRELMATQPEGCEP